MHGGALKPAVPGVMSDAGWMPTSFPPVAHQLLCAPCPPLPCSPWAESRECRMKKHSTTAMGEFTVTYWALFSWKEA